MPRPTRNASISRLILPKQIRHTRAHLPRIFCKHGLALHANVALRNPTQAICRGEAHERICDTLERCLRFLTPLWTVLLVFYPCYSVGTSVYPGYDNADHNNTTTPITTKLNTWERHRRHQQLELQRHGHVDGGDANNARSPIRRRHLPSGDGTVGRPDSFHHQRVGGLLRRAGGAQVDLGVGRRCVCLPCFPSTVSGIRPACEYLHVVPGGTVAYALTLP